MPTRRRTTASPSSAPAPGPALPSVYSNESGRIYHLVRLIGKGGFGEIYLATPSPRATLPERVCVKVSHWMTGWLREAYFAQLLDRHPRALKVFDRFVEAGVARSRYCLVMEYAEHAALRRPPKALPSGRVRSLKGRRVSFTGFLSRPRREAAALAKRAGAIVQGSPGPSTDVLVRGRPNAQQAAGEAAGLKLMEIRRQAARGHKITVIGEAQFWKLVTPAAGARRRGTPARAPRAR